MTTSVWQYGGRSASAPLVQVSSKAMKHCVMYQTIQAHYATPALHSVPKLNHPAASKNK
ncbi:MAG: hypothetical protein V4561_02195 [Bacteroidota bacterium]